MTRGWIAGCVFGLVCACGDANELTQTIVWVDAEPVVRERIASVRAQATGPSADPLSELEAKPPEWPIKFVLAPKNGDASRRFELRVEARDVRDHTLLTVRLATGFVAGQKRYAKLQIHDSCLRAAATCSGGACSMQSKNAWELGVPSSQLAQSAQAIQPLEVTCAPDGSAQPVPIDQRPTPTTVAGTSGGSTRGAAGGAAGAAGGGTAPTMACDAGYVRNPVGCVDVDECETGNRCGDHGRCRNTPGAFQCDCDLGYDNKNGECVSAGCAANNGGCESTCDDASGQVTCSCGGETWLKADHKTCGAFGEPAPLDRVTSMRPMQPMFAFDAQGDGLAVWTETQVASGVTTANVWTRGYVAGKGWDPEPRKLPIDNSGGYPVGAKLALGANGRGVVVWTQVTNADGDIWAVDYHDHTFGEPSSIDDENTGNAQAPAIGVSPNGDGVVAWTQADGNSRTWVNSFSVTRGWAAAQALELDAAMNGSEQALGAQVAVDGHGRANVTWTSSSLDDVARLSFSPWAAHFDPMLMRWHAATRLDTSSRAGLPEVALFGSDRSLAIWPRMGDDGRVSIRSSTQVARGSWSDSLNICAIDSEFTMVSPRLALSESGSGGAIWAQFADSGVQVWANRYDGAAERWGNAMQLRAIDSTFPPAPQLAVDANGNGLGIWSEVRGTAREIRVQRLQADAGFTSSVVVSRDTTANPPANSQVEIAIDSHGNAVAIWDVFEMGRYSVRAAVFE